MKGINNYVVNTDREATARVPADGEARLPSAGLSRRVAFYVL